MARGCASVAVKTGAYLLTPETSNPSQGADLTGSGRGIVGAILILTMQNGHLFVPSRDDPRNG